MSSFAQLTTVVNGMDRPNDMRNPAVLGGVALDAKFEPARSLTSVVEFVDRPDSVFWPAAAGTRVAAVARRELVLQALST